MWHLVKALFIGGLLVVFIVALAPLSHAQDHVWSRRFGDTEYDRGESVAVDEAGNLVVTGTFMGTVDFGGGPLMGAGEFDIFVAKYDAAGAHLWSRRFGDTGSDQTRGVAVDGAGNVVVAGYFTGTVDFGGGPLMGAGSDDIFVAKYDSMGAHIWSRRFGDTGQDWAWSIAVDGAGNVVVTGSFTGTVDFGGGPLMSAGTSDIFVVKYDSTGAHLSSWRFGDINADRGESVAVDEAGLMVVTGYFTGTVDFGGGALVSAGDVDIFVAKYDATGTHIWSRRFGSTSFDSGYSVAFDGAGNVVVTGQFIGTVDYGGGSLISAGGVDVFLAKYDVTGAHIWSRRFGDTDGDLGYSVAVDGAGNVVVTGYFGGTVDFGGGPLMSAGEQDIFVAKYDAAGAHIWSRGFGDTGQDLSYSVAVDGAGNVVVTGFFQGTVDFGGGPLMSAGSDEIFVAKFGEESASVEQPVGTAGVANRLELAEPNPASPGARIRYVVASPGRVLLRVFDTRGRLVETLVDDVQQPRADGYEVQWEGTGEGGKSVGSGVYFYQLDAPGFRTTRKLVVVK